MASAEEPMKVLTIYAHPNPKSFCHAVLDQFTKGLADSGHSNEIVDLYAIGFDPVLRDRDAPSWMDENVPRLKYSRVTEVCTSHDVRCLAGC